MKITATESGDRDEGGPYRFERRVHDRWPVEGAGTAFEVGGDTFGRMHRLRILDFSDAGLGAISDSALPPGSSVSIGFQMPGYPARRGVVKRCLPCGDGYRLAIVFEMRLAA